MFRSTAPDPDLFPKISKVQTEVQASQILFPVGSPRKQPTSGKDFGKQ